jgi:hypothetical protein
MRLLLVVNQMGCRAFYYDNTKSTRSKKNRALYQNTSTDYGIAVIMKLMITADRAITITPITAYITVFLAAATASSSP